MPADLILMGIALSAVALDSALATTERSRRQQILHERQSYSQQSIQTVFYADSGFPESVIAESWREVAKILHVDPSKLRPADRLSGRMGYHAKLRSSQSDVNRLIQTVRGRLDACGRPQPRRISTVDDAVKSLSQCRLDQQLAYSAGGSGYRALPGAAIY